MSKLSVFAISLFLVCVLTGCAQGSVSANASSAQSSTSPASTSSTSVKNGYGITEATSNTVFGSPDRYEFRGETIGVFRASSADCSIENITTWYNQYVKYDMDAWDVVLYTDKPGFGVYAGAGMVEVNTEFDSNYMTANSDGSTLYVFKSDSIMQDGELSLIG